MFMYIILKSIIDYDESKKSLRRYFLFWLNINLKLCVEFSYEVI